MDIQNKIITYEDLDKEFVDLYGMYIGELGIQACKKQSY